VVALIEGEQQTPDNTDSFTIEMKLIRQNWQKANLAAQSVLEKYTLQDLYDQRESYLQKNLMYYI
jgi:DNA-binding IscR family transcriptional regulator